MDLTKTVLRLIASVGLIQIGSLEIWQRVENYQERRRRPAKELINIFRRLTKKRKRFGKSYLEVCSEEEKARMRNELEVLFDAVSVETEHDPE